MSTQKTNLSANFPTGFSPRAGQVELLNRINDAFNEVDFVICCAPTGTGKSFLAKTLGNASDHYTPSFIDDVMSYNAYNPNSTRTYQEFAGASVLTITKSLQDQYKELFPGCESLKGKSNYQCKIEPALDVETAPCVTTPGLKKKCWDDHICPYYEQRNIALISQFSTYNYKMFMALPDNLKNNHFLVCDEASELEGELVNHFSVRVSKKLLKFLSIDLVVPSPHNYNKVFNFVRDSVSSANEAASNFYQDLKRKPSDAKAQKYKACLQFADKMSRILKTWESCEYVIDKDKDDVLSIIPLYVYPLSHSIFKYGKKTLLMSATIIDHKNYAETLGIERYQYIEAPSTFLPEKAPIHISSKYKLNFKNLNDNLPKVTKFIKEICDYHHDEKGAIHTHTNHITSFLKENLDGDRFNFREPGNNNEQMLIDHASHKSNSVIVSPSITHGVDLKGDLATFQIIVKLPYAPLGDKRTKILFEKNKNWYSSQMLMNLVQACGRGVRSEEDECVTYIVDGSVVSAINMNKNKLPKHFLDRIA